MGITTGFINKQKNICPRMKHYKLLSNTNNIIELNDEPPISLQSYAIDFTLLPITFAGIIPLLLNDITDFNKSPSERQISILALLLTKRVAIYSFAYSAIKLCAKRSMSLSENLGERVLSINNEIFQAFGANYTTLLEEQTAPTITQLNDIDGNTQALSLPIIVAGTLISSAIPIVIGSYLKQQIVLDNNNLQESAELIKSIISFLPVLSGIAGAIVCGLFARVELLAIPIFKDLDEKDRESLASILAILLILSCELFPPSISWIFQNLANTAVAVSVARLIALPRLTYVAVALIGLACYDLIAVNTQILTDGGSSIMEAVAVAKSGIATTGTAASSTTTAAAVASTTSNIISLPSKLWLPGLFQINVGGKPSDLLGVGDVVFPSMLASWAKRYDLSFDSGNEDNDESSGLFGASLIGFVLGCLLCEVLQTGQGQPALIYLVPSMFFTVTLQGFKKNIFQDMLQE